MFQHGKIPPHVGIKDQGIEFLRDLEASNISVAPSVVDLGRHREDPAHPTRIMVNNFSAAVSSSSPYTMNTINVF